MGLHAWIDDALRQIVGQLGVEDSLGLDIREAVDAGVLRRSLHLAVMVEPFLQFVLDGSKTIESRFSSVRIPPFRAVASGDAVFLKAAGGPIIGACAVESAWYFEKPTAQDLGEVKRRFGPAIRDDVDGFWDQRQSARYISIMKLGKPKVFNNAVSCEKRDRRGWVILREYTRQTSFSL